MSRSRLDNDSELELLKVKNESLQAEVRRLKKNHLDQDKSLHQKLKDTEDSVRLRHVKFLIS